MLDDNLANRPADRATCADYAPAPQLESEPTEQPDVSVLVLEDDLAQLQILVEHLNSFGLQTETATSLKEAREKLEVKPYQLALFDVQLPDGSSLGLCESIDQDPRLMGLPIIVLSSVPEEQMVRKIRSVGACYFISKPYDPNVLIAIIERALGEAL